MTNIEIIEGPFEGRIYKPITEAKLPGVFLLHGSEGGWSGWSSEFALWLSMHGFITYAFPYSKNGNAWNCGDIENIELDKTEEAMKVFQSEICNDQKYGLFGASRGGEKALLLTSLMAAEGDKKWLPSAVAVHTPADVVVGAFRAAYAREGKEKKSWDPGALSWTWRGSSEEIMPGTPIKIESYKGPMFLSHGTEDMMWSCDMTRRLEKRLKASGKSPEVHYYEGQGHVFDMKTLNIQRKRIVEFFRKNLTSDCGVQHK